MIPVLQHAGTNPGKISRQRKSIIRSNQVNALHAFLRNFVHRPLALPLLVFALALALRLGYLVETRQALYAHTLVLDGYEYDRLAGEILQGAWVPDYRGYVHGLLYPYLLALLKSLPGPDLVTIRLFQAVLGALSCVLIMHLATAAGGPRPTPLIAGLLAAAYWPFIFFGGEVLATTMFLFLELLLAICLLRRPSPWTAAAAGGLLSLLVITRSNAILLAPLLALWLGWQSRDLFPGQRIRHGAACALVFVLGLAPFLAGTYQAQGSVVPYQGGWSFYLGNNPEADGTPYVRQGLAWQRLAALPWFQGQEKPAAQRTFFLAEGLAFIGHDPVSYAELLYQKFRLFWHRSEIPVSADLRYYEKESRLSRILVADFGLLAPLALVGMLRNLRRRQILLLGFVLAFLLSGLLFSVCARYRLPAVPFLLIFAAWALVAAWQRLRAKDARRGGIFAALLLAAALLVHTGVDARAVDHLRSSWLQGHVLQRTGQYARAHQAYRQALQHNPDDADVHNSLGALYQTQGRWQDAETAYRKAVRLAPDHARAQLNLAALYMRRNRRQEARPALLAAAAADPRPPVQYEAHYKLGHLHLQQEDFPQALQAFLKALAVRPSAPAYYGMASAVPGQTQAQRRALEQAVALDSTFAPALRNLGAVYYQLGEFQNAEQKLLQAIRHDPGAPQAYRNLNAVYQRLGHPEQARRALATARRLSSGSQGGP